MSFLASRRAKTVDVTVIIVNFNVREYLANALRSLSAALAGVTSEIIVVDNASEDGSVEMLRRRFPQVRCIASKTNLGFAKANNLGIQAARGTFMLLLNPDTIVQEDTVRTMVHYFRSHERVGLAGCRILNPDGSFQLAARRSFPTPWVAFSRMSGLSRLFPRSRMFGKYNLTYMPTDRSYPVDAVSGSFMFVRRSVVESVGGLDEAYFMYGEDLDWCYRIRKAGWEVHYVCETSIIHYKGESTRRSSIDEIGLFYRAMQIFVEKHFGDPGLTLFFLNAGIRTAAFGALVSAYAARLWPAVIDATLVAGSLLASGIIRRGAPFVFPTYAYPVVYIVPPMLVVFVLISMGVYSRRAMSISRTVTGVALSFVILSALTAFFKDYAFSRAMILTTGALSVILLPGWRVAYRAFRSGSSPGRSTVFGRRAAIVGTGANAATVAQRLRSRVTDGFDVIGTIMPPTTTRNGDEGGPRVLGTTDSMRSVVRAFHLSDIIVTPEALSNRQLLSLIAETRGLPVAFHLVAETMDYFVGKASVETLEDVPLVEVSYSIQRPVSRFIKRAVDIGFAAVGLITVYPFVYLFHRERFNRGAFVRLLPAVFSGRMSLVGPPASVQGSFPSSVYIGKPGLAGLIQVRADDSLNDEEKEQLALLYARSQSFLLDLEILLKHLIEHYRRSD